MSTINPESHFPTILIKIIRRSITKYNSKYDSEGSTNPQNNEVE